MTWLAVNWPAFLGAVIGGALSAAIAFRIGYKWGERFGALRERNRIEAERQTAGPQPFIFRVQSGILAPGSVAEARIAPGSITHPRIAPHSIKPN